MAEDIEQEGPVFIRVTNKDVYAEVIHTKDAVAALRQDMQNMMTENTALRSIVTANTGRLERLESRFNNILVGLGTGILVGLVAVFRGVIGG
jgi:hypothetical protein